MLRAGARCMDYTQGRPGNQQEGEYSNKDLNPWR